MALRPQLSNQSWWRARRWSWCLAVSSFGTLEKDHHFGRSLGCIQKNTGNRFSKPDTPDCALDYSAVLASKPISASSPVEAGPLGPSPYSSDLNAMGKQPKTVDTLENLWNTFQVTEGKPLGIRTSLHFLPGRCLQCHHVVILLSIPIHTLGNDCNFTDKCCKCSYTLSILIITCHDGRKVLALELEWDECRNEHSKSGLTCSRTHVPFPYNVPALEPDMSKPHFRKRHTLQLWFDVLPNIHVLNYRN